MREYKYLLFEKKENIAIVTIHRPEALNALNFDVLNDLKSMFAEIAEDNEIKAVVLTGEAKSFVAGADIALMKEQTTLEGREFIIYGQSVMNAIENMDIPVIAAVNGFALGGGCELSMACDIRIASSKAKFGQPEVGLGIIPGFGGTQRLARLVGKGNANYLIYTADIIKADEALRMGLVQKVVEPDELLDAAIEMASKIASKAPIAIKMAKKAINNGLNTDINTGVNFEAEAFAVSFSTEDRVEGMSAFLGKRNAEFKSK